MTMIPVCRLWHISGNIHHGGTERESGNIGRKEAQEAQKNREKSPHQTSELQNSSTLEL
jgi:hypothetical protein